MDGKRRKTAEELHLTDVLSITNKNSLKRLIQEEISTKILDDIENETLNKTKVKHWKERKENIQVGKRPAYMDKLTRKQCKAIIKTRALMLAVKTNFKRANETDPVYRFCAKEKETQGQHYSKKWKTGLLPQNTKTYSMKTPHD